MFKWLVNNQPFSNSTESPTVYSNKTSIKVL